MARPSYRQIFPLDPPAPGLPSAKNTDPYEADFYEAEVDFPWGPSAGAQGSFASNG